MTSALDLPEIRSFVAQFLPPSSLAVCARVSKDWLDSFTPFLWRKILLIESIQVDEPTLSKYSAQIRDLSVKSGAVALTLLDTPDLFTFPGLTHLTLIPRMSEQQIEPFLHHHHNRQWKDLKIVQHSFSKRLDLSWIKDCQNLKRIVLGGRAISPEDWKLCLDSWRSSCLLELGLNLTQFGSGSFAPINTPAPPPNTVFLILPLTLFLGQNPCRRSRT